MSSLFVVNIPLSESQQTGAFVADTMAAGQMELSYDETTKVLSIRGEFSDLSSALLPIGGQDGTGAAESAIHVHLGEVGRNGPIAFNLEVTDNGDGSGTFGREVQITDDQLALLMAGDYYVNVHTEDNIPGELRGQIDVDTGQFDIVDSANPTTEGQQVGTPPADGPASGNVEVLFDGRSHVLEVTGTFSGLSSDLLPVGPVDSAGNPQSAVHIHTGIAGQNGGIVRNLTVTDNGDGSGSYTGRFVLTDEEVANLRSDALYVNIHTVDNPSGELRGQLTVEQDVSDIVVSDFPMTEDQQPTNTPADGAAEGTINVSLDADTLTLTVTGTFEGLTSDLLPIGGEDPAGNPESAIHIHQGPRGENGPIFRNLTVTDNEDGSGSFSGTYQLADESEAKAFAADQFYINVHTVDNPSGELRGQIDLGSGQFDDVTLSIPLSESQQVGNTPADTASTGSYSVTYDAETGRMTIEGSFENLTSDLRPVGGEDALGNPESAIHLHSGAAGANGPIAVNMTVSDNGDGSGTFSSSFSVSEDDVADFDAGNFYINIHTVDNPSGELRGQLTLSSPIQDRTVERTEILGTVDADTLVTTDANDIVRAFAGDDLIDGSGGSDIIDGNAGFDVVSFELASDDITVAISDDGEAAVGSELGETTTVNVEALDLSDGSLRLDVAQGANAGFLARLYETVFGREGDAEGQAFWIGVLDDGQFDFAAVAEFFLNSSEFSTRYGEDLSDAEFLDVMYDNLRGSDADQAGLDFWSDALEAGFARSETATAFAESAEQVSNLVGELDEGVFFADVAFG